MQNPQTTSETIIKYNDIGSQWRIWDLHIHPVNNNDSYKTFINNLKESKADVIGINDYFSLDAYKDILAYGGVQNKVLFPVVEFRMNNIVSKRSQDPTHGGARINFHIIFDNDPTLLDDICSWLNSLSCKEEGNPKLLSAVKDKMRIDVDYFEVIASLEKFLLGKFLVWLPYDEYGGISEIDPKSNSFFKLSLTKKAHIFGSSTKQQIDFFKWKNPTLSKEQYLQWFDKPKPCIKGSDSHEVDYPFGHLKNDNSEPIDKFCWIKADVTFAGLKQIINEPERVFIGLEPDLLKRVRNNPTKFISKLLIKNIAPTSKDNVWFENFSVDVNSSLVAIIGNKGNGKSAITDIISLCANTHQSPTEFSFLTNQKFRKPKPYNLADKFEATLLWHDGTSFTKRLSSNPELTSPERVKYIPQHFLETLCANVDSNGFEDQLKQIIYSHTPFDKRLGKSSLDDLIDYNWRCCRKMLMPQ